MNSLQHAINYFDVQLGGPAVGPLTRAHELGTSDKRFLLYHSSDNGFMTALQEQLVAAKGLRK